MLRDNTESVYNLIPPQPPSSKRRRSYHKSKVKVERDNALLPTKRGRATFGHPLGSLKPCPTGFLKKHSKHPNKFSMMPWPKMRLKPLIPHEQPVMGLKSGRNYVNTNAIEVIHATPKKLPKHVPRAIEKPSYGKVPRYLVKINRLLKKKQNEAQDYQKKQESFVGLQPNTRRLEEHERHDLIEGLKKKWDQVNAAYHKTSVTLDTWTKKARKEAFESQLMQIEKDIQTLSRRVVLVVDKGKSQSSRS